MTVETIAGGITAPAGFRAAGVAAGIKASGAPDVALIVPDRPAAGAALFTTNQVQAAPVTVSREHLRASGGRVAAVLVNSGCANACTGSDGLAVARASTADLASRLGCPVEQVVVASTGVIGVGLRLAAVQAGIERGLAALSADGHPAARAIMTTDLGPKEAAVRVNTADGPITVGGIAKGAGMIEPMLATMLGFVTTDAAVAPDLLQRALAAAVATTFNAITVDGECSTNDTVIALASGAGPVAVTADRHYDALVAGLTAVCRALALMIVRGGEGATKLVAIRVTGAQSVADARQVAKTIANSPLVKTAVHGGDPNWGRLVAAAGRSGIPFSLEGALVRVGPVVLFRDGQPHDEAAPEAARYLRGTEIDIEVNVGTGGPHEATVWTCDLSAEYVRINGEYPDMSLAAVRQSAAPTRRDPAATRSFLSVLDFTPEQLEACLALAVRLKRERALGPCAPTATALAGRHVALLFDKPSLRTRTTFEVATRELGGHVLALPAEVALGTREPVADVARNLERWVHAVVIRTYGQQIVEEFAAAAPSLAVINALTDQQHPCQVLADYLTLQEVAGTLPGQTIAYVGDGNNVAASLAQAGAMLGVNVHLASPRGYALPDEVVESARRVARHGASIRQFLEPESAVRGAAAVYTDVWTSMGQEAERDERLRIFEPFQVNAELMARAGKQARFMHCLPAHQGEEVSAEVFESAASVVFDEAENRLHTQKALLLMLLAPQHA